MAGCDLRFVEARAVVDDAHQALALSLLDPNVRPARARVLAGIREPLLDDPEHLDLLVGREPDPVFDLELDLELPVGGEEVDVAAQSRVERGRAAGGREGQDGEAPTSGSRLLFTRGYSVFNAAQVDGYIVLIAAAALLLAALVTRLLADRTPGSARSQNLRFVPTLDSVDLPSTESS